MPVQQAGHGEHAHQQRQGQQRRDTDLDQRLVGGGRLLRLPLQQLLTTAARRALRQLGVKADLLDPGAQGGGGLHPRHQHETGLFE